MSTPQPTDPHERMAGVRQALLDGAIWRARGITANLGIVLTDEQADAAGARLLKQEQAERAAQARASLAARRATRNSDFAVRMAGEYAQRYLDLWGSYKDADVNEVKRDFYEDARVELYETPDGFKSGRLIHRLEARLAEARARSWATTAQLDATLVNGQPDWDSLPDLRDLSGPLPGDLE